MASKVNLKRVILHIGRHKSGTSSIQHCLNRNVDLLSAAGILYPKHGRGGRVAHHDIAKALIELQPLSDEGQQLMFTLAKHRRLNLLDAFNLC